MARRAKRSFGHPVDEAITFIEKVLAISEGKSELTLLGFLELEYHADPNDPRSAEAMLARLAAFRTQL